MAEVAEELGPESGLEVEIFDEQQLIEMGCGGILGVNLGSVDEPRLIKMTLPPRLSRPATSAWSARGSCTTPAASASSRATSRTPR